MSRHVDVISPYVLVIRSSAVAKRPCDFPVLIRLYWATTADNNRVRQTERITSRLVFTARLRPRSECPQLRSERRAQFRVPNVPRCRISERAPFRIYDHAQCRVFGRTSLQRAYVIPCRQQMGSSAVLRARRSALVLAASMRCLRRAHSIGRGCRVHTCVIAIGADFKMYLLRQFCSNRVKFFLQCTGDTDAKNDGTEF